MSTEMISLTIDGLTVTVPKGTSMIEAAKQAGIVVPHYCYHPSLPSPAVCRMCLVEVEKLPKLVPSCVTPVADGQVIHVHSPAAKKAREGVLEFLLINHPLDCPICDQSGECELQDFVFQEGRAGTRYADEAKRWNPVEEFGPDVLYIPNRCILCTRCVRFMDHVAEAPVLNVSERGDRAYIGIDPDHALDHPWSGNVVDLCPVGSLISKDFLHKARAWDLDKSASICTGCTQGCNVTVDTRDEAVVRIRPRANLEVNRHFICDVGRADYRWMNRGDRVETPLLVEAGQAITAEWEPALAAAIARIEAAEGEVVVLFGGRVSCESIGWVLRALEPRAVTAAIHVPLGPEAPLAGVPNLALRRERAANLHGAMRLGVHGDWAASVAGAAAAAVVIVVDAPLDDVEAAQVAEAGTVIHLATIADPRIGAAVIFPITTVIEEQGVFVNRDGRAQRYLPVRTPRGMSRPAWWVGARLRRDTSPPDTASEALRGLAAFGGLSHRDIGYTGRLLEQPVEAGR